MSQILRLCCGHTYKTSQITHLTDIFKEVTRFSGCKNCRVLRCKQGREGHNVGFRRETFTSQRTKIEPPVIAIHVAIESEKSVGRQLQKFRKVLRHRVVQCVCDAEARLDCPVQSVNVNGENRHPDCLNHVLPDAFGLNKLTVLTTTQFQPLLEDVKHEEVRWGAQLRRFNKNVREISVDLDSITESAQTNLDENVEMKVYNSLSPVKSFELNSNISSVSHNIDDTKFLEHDSKESCDSQQLIEKRLTKETIITTKPFLEKMSMNNTQLKIKKEVKAHKQSTELKENRVFSSADPMEVKAVIESAEPEKVKSAIGNTDRDELKSVVGSVSIKVKDKKVDLKSKNVQKVKTEQQIIELKQQTFNCYFKSFVDVCLYSGKADVAYNIVKTMRFHNDDKFKITDVTIYSSLLHDYAKTSHYSKMVEIFDRMKQTNIKPSLQCYAAFLEFIGRQKVIDEQKGHNLLKDIETEGYDVRNIFNECVMLRDERKFIYQALNQLIDNFDPHPTQGSVPYSGPLVKHMNSPKDPSQVQEMNPFSGIISEKQLHEQLNKQMELEMKNIVNVMTIEKKMPHSNKEMEKKVEELKSEWRSSMLAAFKQKLKVMHSNEKHKYLKMSVYFKLFDPDVYVDLMMLEIENLAMGSSYYSPPAYVLWRGLGERIYDKYLTTQKQQLGITDKVLQIYKDFIKEYSDPDFAYNNHRECWDSLCNKHIDGPTIGANIFKNWQLAISEGIGRILYELIIKECKIQPTLSALYDDQGGKVPVFYYVYRTNSSEAEVKPHPVFVKLFSENNIQHVPFNVRDLPMLVPPVPWFSRTSGGYLLHETNLVRFSLVEEKIKAVEMLHPSLDALNVIGMCAWRINKPMLELIIDVFNNKGNKDLDIAPPVSECPPLPHITQDMKSEEKEEIWKMRKELKKQKQEMYSLWCSELYRLSIANMYKDDIFWFPHNFDFRGRTYPCPPHFNHVGGDVARSLLYFAKGKPLGDKGLDWLKIHLINMTGFKKRSSNAERLAFANEMLGEIMDSADNPMTGKRWWQTSDEPWQTLAACREVAQAVRSPDPTKYICHYPVHQDGSCNGLQHYAALGRDQAGALSVNLIPCDRPNDVYSDIAEMVESVRKEDAANGNLIAQICEGFVRRKVIKQTVMTTVYGVTQYGAKAQILKQLKDIPEFPVEHQWPASVYLTHTTFECLKKMFKSSKEIQEWLIECADLVSKVCKKPVEWITPLGFPVLQPYFKTQAIGHNVFGFGRPKLHENMVEIPNLRKQKNGFPPNFIHSLDSVHMMLTALHCWRAGITFVSVHDCYWTHPCDADIMNKICREQFIALHSQPILENLSQFLLDNFKDIPKNKKIQKQLEETFKSVPERGTFDLNNVRNSTYFFS